MKKDNIQKILGGMLVLLGIAIAFFIIGAVKSPTLASHTCGSCPAGEDCGFDGNQCCEDHGCACNCNNNQCNTMSGWDSQCPGSYCCGGGGGNKCDDPDQPSITFPNITARSARIDWVGVGWGDESGSSCQKPPNNGIGCGGNQGYVGRLCTGDYCYDGGTEIATLSCTSNTHWEVSGLTPGTTYYVYIWSVNECGCDKRNKTTFTTAPGAAVQGRVKVDPSPFFRPSCASCGSGSCEEMPNLSVACTIAGEDPVSGSWGCNTGGAFYSTGRAFAEGDVITCSAQMTSTNYKFTSWYIDNANNDDDGLCINQNSCTTSSVTLDEGPYPPPNQGLNDLHFLVEPVPRDPWWQVINGDVAANGSLLSLIPLSTCDPSSVCDSFFDLPPLDGGYPGIPSYIGEADFAEGVGDSGSVSETGWLAESRTILSRVYDYGYFEDMIPPDVEVNIITADEITGGDLISGKESGGYTWFKKEEGDLAMKGVAVLGNRKVILLVNGTLTFGENPTAGVRLNDGFGFFAAIARDDIVLSPKVKIDPLDRQPVLEGIFLAGREFKTGTTGVKDDGQLWLRGSVVAYGGISLERDMTSTVPPDLNNDEYPAELFEYGPDLLLTFPRELTSRRLRWKEVAP